MDWKTKLIHKLADLLGVEYRVEVTIPAPPVDMVQTLDDDPRRIYVWITSPETDDADLQIIAAQLEKVQRDRGLKSVHILSREIRDVRDLRPEDVRQYILPSLEGV